MMFCKAYLTFTLEANDLLPEKENEATVAMMAKRERTLANIVIVSKLVVKLWLVDVNVESPRLHATCNTCNTHSIHFVTF